MIGKRKPYMLTNQNSTAFWLIDNLWMPLASSHHTQDKFSLMEQVCGTGIGGPQAHMHPMDEGMFILEGHITFQVGGQELKAGPGTFASIPHDTEHSFTIDVADTRVLNFYVPGGFEMFIMSLAVPAQERKSPVPGTTPLPPRWMAMEASHEFGQIAAPTMPIADPPTEENRATKPSALNPIRPYGVRLDEAPSFWAQRGLVSVLASCEQTGGAYSLLHKRCPRGFERTSHKMEQEEAFYVLEGELTVTAEDEQYIARPGSFVYLPGDTNRSFVVNSGEVQWLTWRLPGAPTRMEDEIDTSD